MIVLMPREDHSETVEVISSVSFFDELGTSPSTGGGGEGIPGSMGRSESPNSGRTLTTRVGTGMGRAGRAAAEIERTAGPNNGSVTIRAMLEMPNTAMYAK